ncbi:MAG TPA: hypothetical protein VF772_23555, partial [Terriglobales bacterium]
VDQTAEAIRAGLEMDPAERKERMQRMRKQVREQNIYHWAADLIGQLAEFRVETPKNNNVDSTASHINAA